MMTKNIYPLFLSLILSLSSFSEIVAKDFQLILKSGTERVTEQNVEVQIAKINTGSSYKIVTFAQLPNLFQKELMGEAGIRLYHYLPENSYYAWIPKDLTQGEIKKHNFFAVNEISDRLKFHPLAVEIPSWAFDKKDRVNLILNYFDDRSDEALRNDLMKIDARLVQNNTFNRRAFISIPKDKISMLTSLNYIYFIEAVDPPSEPENYGGRQQHRSNMMAQEFSSGHKYDGTGISIGMHDDGIIGPHIDYEGRLPIQFPTTNNGDHGDHVAGTIMGAGNLDPDTRGMAFGADLYVYSAANSNYNSAPNHYNNYDVIITSKSYSNGCNAGYTSLSQQLDQQSRLYPALVHVFSAGNNGTSDCSYGAGSGWGNITGGHKMGKNVITTGNLTSADALATSSSRGPADDGRIKPDICAKGTSVYSTIDDNTYGFKTGTSMSCPGISGSMAQLYHAYKDLNSAQNPPSALMKGIMLNTADDLGNPGPDYKFGWGRVNLRRALEVLEQVQYIAGSIDTNVINHSLNVPANVEQVRIMVYWHDYEASTSAARAIVNNIDMTVTDPSSNAILPWVLNPAPNATTLNSNAIRAIDSLNNMEQVTIDNPSQGTYTISLNPTSIPQGPQQYFVIYEFVYNEIFLTYPNGGEGLVPFESEIIRWDAYGNSGTFNLEYTTNGGTSWTSISSSVSASDRQFTWSVPNIVTDQMKVRITRGLISDESDANINVIRVPSGLKVDWICPDSMQISWNAVTQANSYRAYKLGPKYMDSTGTTSGTSFIYRNVPLNEKFWVSVSSNPSVGSTGKRAIAIQTSGVQTSCPLEDDAAVSTVVNPDASTYFTCNLPQIGMYIRNAGTTVIQNVSAGCIVDGNQTFTGSYSAALSTGDSARLDLAGQTTFATGLHSIKCYVSYSGDPNSYNDSTELSYFNVKTASATSLPWSEDFESMALCGDENDCGTTVCTLLGWVNDSSLVIDDHDWRIDNNGTPSGNTGPSVDHKPGTAAGRYAFTEASGDCNFQRAQMVSTCIDLSENNSPELTYWYHMFGQDMGEMHLDVLHNGVWDYDVTPKLFGDRGFAWREVVVDLKDYAGEIINLRFRGITGNDYRSDMAIDDISMTDPYTGISQSSNRSIRLYPNPATHSVTIDFGDADANYTQVEFLDVTGKTVLSKLVERIDENNTSIDIRALTPGVYMVRLIGEVDNFTQRLIVQ
ncbi:MAG: S8 family serine peptidase [Vicingaceae bacterium]